MTRRLEEPRLVAKATSCGEKGSKDWWGRGYVLMAFLVFGYSYNATPLRCGNDYCRFDRAIVSALRGVAWPVYFAGNAAILVTKPIAGGAA